jgi:hypothetical protein
MSYIKAEYSNFNFIGFAEDSDHNLNLVVLKKSGAERIVCTEILLI